MTTATGAVLPQMCWEWCRLLQAVQCAGSHARLCGGREPPVLAHKCALPHSTCATCRFWYTGEGGRNDKTNTQVRSTVDKLHCWACACDAASAALVPPWCRLVLPFRPCWLPTPHHKNPLPLANPQVKDQAWVRGNAALRNAQLHGTPVRVVRAAARNGDPKQGFEYT